MKTNYQIKMIPRWVIIFLFVVLSNLPSILFSQPPDVIPISCGQTVQNNIDSLGTGSFDNYSCTSGLPGWDNSPHEVVYGITVNIPTTIYVTLIPTGTSADFNLFVLTALNPSDCQEWAKSTSVSPPFAPFVLITNLIPVTPPQTFYIVVDGCKSHGYGGFGSFSLQLECDTCETCDKPCPNPVDSLHTGIGPFGGVDPNWNITTPPHGPADIVNWHGIGWSAPMPYTNWISIDTTGSAVTGTYVFERQFEYDTNSCIIPELTLCVMVDDTALIYLNNNYIGTAMSQHTAEKFSTTTGFIQGTNILKVVVINNPGAFMGLDLRCWICCLDNQGVEEMENGKPFKIYPNPASDYFDLEAREDINLLEIYTLEGKLIGEYDQLNKKARISTNRIPTGFYIMMIKMKDNAYKEKLIIAR